MSKVEHNKKLFELEQKENKVIIDNSGLDIKEILKEDKQQEPIKEVKSDKPQERVISYKFKGGRPKGSLNKKTIKKLKGTKKNIQTNTPTVGLITQEQKLKETDNNANSMTTNKE